MIVIIDIRTTSFTTNKTLQKTKSHQVNKGQVKTSTIQCNGDNSINCR